MPRVLWEVPNLVWDGGIESQKNSWKICHLNLVPKVSLELDWHTEGEGVFGAEQSEQRSRSEKELGELERIKTAGPWGGTRCWDSL